MSAPAAVPSLGPRRATRDVTALLVGPAFLAVACVAVAASGVVAAGVSAVLGVVAALAVAHVVVNGTSGSSSRVVAAIGGRIAAPHRDARLLNLVEGLCSAFGLAAPTVVVIDSDELNAVSFVRRGRSTVVVTSSAVEELERIELEALLAHELSHLRRGDTARAASVMRALGFLARHSPTVAGRCARFGGPDRESYADFAATSVTRYPPALADTLSLVDQNRGALSRALPVDLVRLTWWQWCAPLESDANVAIGLSLADRAQALREL